MRNVFEKLSGHCPASGLKLTRAECRIVREILGDELERAGKRYRLWAKVLRDGHGQAD